jgi:hypothetical protein
MTKYCFISKKKKRERDKKDILHTITTISMYIPHAGKSHIMPTSNLPKVSCFLSPRLPPFLSESIRKPSPPSVFFFPKKKKNAYFVSQVSIKSLL